jgi:hypothetical protein
MPVDAGAATEATPGADTRGRGDGGGGVVPGFPAATWAEVCRGAAPVGRRPPPSESGDWQLAQVCDCIELKASH